MLSTKTDAITLLLKNRAGSSSPASMAFYPVFFQHLCWETNKQHANYTSVWTEKTEAGATFWEVPAYQAFSCHSNSQCDSRSIKLWCWHPDFVLLSYSPSLISSMHLRAENEWDWASLSCFDSSWNQKLTNLFKKLFTFLFLYMTFNFYRICWIWVI